MLCKMGNYYTSAKMYWLVGLSFNRDTVMLYTVLNFV